jgi:endonuclease/exonuclease/phosphatase family metal-dependent hydrolase
VPDIRVATYNVYLGADLSLLFDATDADQLAERIERVRAQLVSTRSHERACAVAALLVREQPDLVGLQEVSRWTVRADGGPEETVVDFMPELVAALDAAGCGYDVHAVNENFTGAMPVGDGVWMGLTGANVTLVRRDADVVVVDSDAAVYDAGHTVVTRVERLAFPVVRGWGRVDVRVAGAPLRFVNTHLEAYDAATREAQRDEVLAVNADIDAPLVLVGDFNARPDVVAMPEGWVDAWSAGDGAGATCCQAGDLTNRDSGLHERIDYVWLRDPRVRRAETFGDRGADRSGGSWPSDHAGVLADLSW